MAIAKHAYTMKFSSELIAHNVLFVPDFNINLLSVCKLCLGMDCMIVFDNDKCLI